MDERYYSLDPDVDPQPYQVARSLMIEDRAVWTSINLKILCFEVIHCVNTKADFSWVQRFWSHSALNWLNEICIVSYQRLPLEVLELKVEKQNKIKNQPTNQTKRLLLRYRGTSICFIYKTRSPETRDPPDLSSWILRWDPAL